MEPSSTQPTVQSRPQEAIAKLRLRLAEAEVLSAQLDTVNHRLGVALARSNRVLAMGQEGTGR